MSDKIKQIAAAIGISVVSVTGTALFIDGEQVPDVVVQFDTKGLEDIKVQALISETDFHDAIYYTPEEWSSKTAEDIAADRQARYDKWVEFSKEQSKLISNEVTP
jgi:hypothetical protein